MYLGAIPFNAKERGGTARIVHHLWIVYVRAWIEASLWPPLQTLLLLQRLVMYSNARISRMASTKFANHLWDLNEELVSMAFFDDRVPAAENRAIPEAIEEDGVSDPPKR